MQLRKGMLAISKAGHDKDSWYVVAKVEKEQALLINGKNRTWENPKKKKLKHLQPVNEVPEILQEKLQNGTQWTNEEVKRALKLAQTGLI